MICYLKNPENKDFSGYADDATRHTSSSNIEKLPGNIQETLEKMFHWFSTNLLLASTGKYLLLASSKTPVNIHITA